MSLSKQWRFTTDSVLLQRAMHEDVTYTKRGVPRTGRATSDQMHIAVRDSNIEIVSMVLEALESEHDFLCAPCPHPGLQLWEVMCMVHVQHVRGVPEANAAFAGMQKHCLCWWAWRDNEAPADQYIKM